ncbi:MAG TPA: hypothetical protein VN782_10715 [Usitatibacter sp.]|nr:hypothetical protein [Usitatibacter sp.]
MRTPMKALLAAAGAGILVASCATGPYDNAYGYDEYGYPAYGYPGYDYGYDYPGYYYGPSVALGGVFIDRDHRHFHHHGDDGHFVPTPAPSGPRAAPCCGPGTGPGGSVTQRDADRWGAGG